MKRVVVRLAAVTLACLITASVLAGGGRLIVFGTGLPRPASSENPSLPVAIPVQATPQAVAVAASPAQPAAAPAETAPAVRYSATPFRSGGRGYLGITSRAPGLSFAAPIPGTIEIRLYQFIEGEVRVGSNVPSLPFFPYVTIVSADARLTYRPGALGSVAELSVADGRVVVVGDPLFRLLDAGRSSWATFYDTRAPYDVLGAANLDRRSAPPPEADHWDGGVEYARLIGAARSKPRRCRHRSSRRRARKMRTSPAKIAGFRKVFSGLAGDRGWSYSELRGP